MTMTYPPARPFTCNDWHAFAGAETWPMNRGTGDLVQPVLREIGNWLLVADRNGMEAYCNGKDYTQGIFRLDLALPTQALALALLNGLPDDFNPALYGF